MKATAPRRGGCGMPSDLLTSLSTMTCHRTTVRGSRGTSRRLIHARPRPAIRKAQEARDTAKPATIQTSSIAGTRRSFDAPGATATGSHLAISTRDSTMQLNTFEGECRFDEITHASTSGGKETTMSAILTAERETVCSSVLDEFIATQRFRAGRDRNIPILLGLNGLANLRDGALYADTIDQRQWEAMYGELAVAAEQTIPPLSAMFDLADSQQGAVAIGVLNVQYQAPDRRLAGALRRAVRDQAALELPPGTDISDMIETRTAFAACAILPPAYWGVSRQQEVHDGLEVHFKLQTTLYVSNGELPDRLEIDFGDGGGFRPVLFDTESVVTYDEAGEQRIVLRAWFGDEARCAAFRFIVADAARHATPPERGNGAPVPASRIHVRASIAHEGKHYQGVMHVYWAWSNRSGKLRKPLLLAEGFPGKNDANAIYDYFNGFTGERNNPNAKLADELRVAGYDLVILIFDERGSPIQGNAFVYLEALCWIRDNGAQGRPRVHAMGGSMGGLIARYALAYAEQQRLDPGDVAALTTFDSPHQAANVPLAAQITARFFAYRQPDPDTLLNYRAAKQMLIHQVWRWDGERESLTKPEFSKFYAELEALAFHGYPTRPKKYAICNGALDSHVVSIPGGAKTLSVERTDSPTVYRVELWATPNKVFNSKTYYAELYMCDQTRNARVFYSVDSDAQGFYTRDGCAGGLAKNFKTIYDALICPQRAALHYELNCFIPVHSALGVPRQDAYAFEARTVQPGDTPFNKWYVPAGNQPHCTVDEGIKNWVLARVAEHVLQPGDTVALKASNGLYLSRYWENRDCLYASKPARDYFCLFKVVAADRGGFALKADNGNGKHLRKREDNYMAPDGDGVGPDSTFTLDELPGGEHIRLKLESGGYLRYRGSSERNQISVSADGGDVTNRFVYERVAPSQQSDETELSGDLTIHSAVD
ncbi:hypothetical protein HL667_04895 [Bradyrhizobium sp. 83012]|uniref:DUF676 domain-containing protein n=1 Tax=Bradyrhizobium aeschynomenes TaxID=2734909 RepID=A0ABX2C8H7_9BRAD|nr:hypothetical protein [Bradyrhizobium aeschynomenes]NPU64328.1 hypothetical protein [Bradyrhizobium aeschynomenes]